MPLSQPSPLHANSSDEFFPDNTQQREFWSDAAKIASQTERSEVSRTGTIIIDDHSAEPASHTSDKKSTGAHGPDDNVELEDVEGLGRIDKGAEDRGRSSSPEPRKIVLSTSSDDVLWEKFSDPLDLSEQEVEDLVDPDDADSDDNEGPSTTQESSVFSQPRTDSTSVTSILTLSDGNASQSRKRTFVEMESAEAQSCPTSPLKARRTTNDAATSAYPRSISHDTALLSRLALAEAPVASSSKETLKASPAKVAQLHSKSCGWDRCDSPFHNHDKSFGDKSENARHHGATEDPVIIAHDSRVQALLDKLEVAWGTQFEIARGVLNGSWTWDDVTEDLLQQLRGSNAESAVKVRRILKPAATSDFAPNFDLYQELDREEAALLEHEHRGLGLRGEWKGAKHWFGGQIQQVLYMSLPAEGDGILNPDSPSQFKLSEMEMSRSHRFGRYVGSRNILQLKFPKNQAAKFRHMLERKFVLCGRIFRPFDVKDGTAYMLGVNEDIERTHLLPADHYRISLEDFVDWHNPPQYNLKQPVTKWATRFKLGLSTSVPVLWFEPENIFMINDIYAEHEEGVKPTTEQCLTDGCGLINVSALIAITQALELRERPTAIQGRIYGAKGMWLLDPTKTSPDDPPMIWIRPSQIKIKYGEASDTAIPNLSPAHYIFDLVSPAMATASTRLSRLTILNLAHNGVSAKTLVALMKESLEAELLPLMQWTGNGAMERLWAAIDKATSTTMGLVHESAAGMQRALGLSRWSDDKRDTLAETVGVEVSKVNPSRYLPGGKPIFGGELCMRLLQSGFCPTEEPFLHDELRKVVRNKAISELKKYHITVKNSFEAPLLADPFNILEENEIAFTSSSSIFDTATYDRRTLKGEVLIFRNPARVPSDVRKVKAVSSDALAKLTDVILLPTKGPISLASLLAGGDLDGDTGVVIHEPSIVEEFHNAPVVERPPDLTGIHFEPLSEIQQVSSMHEKLETLRQSSPPQVSLSLQKCLLSGLTDSRVGLYSRFHELSAYKNGYGHQETLRLARVFETELDSSKTGLRLRKEVFEKDSRKYKYDLPECMNEGEEFLGENTPNRPRDLGPFILDELLDKGKHIRDALLARYENHHVKPEDDQTGCMIKPYLNANRCLKNEVDAVVSFVDLLVKEWLDLHSPAKKEQSLKGNASTGGLRRTPSRPLAARLVQVRSLATRFNEGPIDGVHDLRKLGLLHKIMAAYAYSQKRIFAFNMAFDALCTIRAEHSRHLVPCIQSFAGYMSIASSARRVLARAAAPPE